MVWVYERTLLLCLWYNYLKLQEYDSDQSNNPAEYRRYFE